MSFMTKPEVVEGIVQAIDAPTLENYLRISAAFITRLNIVDPIGQREAS